MSVRSINELFSVVVFSIACIFLAITPKVKSRDFLGVFHNFKHHRKRRRAVVWHNPLVRSAVRMLHWGIRKPGDEGRPVNSLFYRHYLRHCTVFQGLRQADAHCGHFACLAQESSIKCAIHIIAGADECKVSKRLRKVPECLTRRSDLFSIETNMIGVGEHLF